MFEIKIEIFLFSRHITVKEVAVDLDKYIVPWQGCFAWWLVLD